MKIFCIIKATVDLYSFSHIEEVEVIEAYRNEEDAKKEVEKLNQLEIGYENGSMYSYEEIELL